MSDGELNEQWMHILRPTKRVFIDIDDCLMPWAEVVHQACVAAGLAEPGSTWSTWHMYKDYGCTKEQWLEVVNSLVVEGGMYHSPPYPGSVEALRKLESSGAELHLVTARGFFDNSELIRKWTYDWVEAFNVPGRLQFAQRKGEWALKVGATHAIDDGIHNVRQLREVGVDAYLLNQPHNHGEFFPRDHRVDSVVEFVERIIDG